MVPSEPSDEEQGSEYGERSLPVRQPLRRKCSSQNQNRNIIPNIIQQIFSYLSKAKKSRNMCERVFSHLQSPAGVVCTIQRFYSFHRLIKDNMNHYVNQGTLNIFKHPLDKHF